MGKITNMRLIDKLLRRLGYVKIPPFHSLSYISERDNVILMKCSKMITYDEIHRSSMDLEDYTREQVLRALSHDIENHIVVTVDEGSFYRSKVITAHAMVMPKNFTVNTLGVREQIYKTNK